LEHIYFDWSGVSIKSNEIDKHKKTAKNYKLNGFNFYEHIKAFGNIEDNDIIEYLAN
jgi:hypothetical protein